MTTRLRILVAAGLAATAVLLAVLALLAGRGVIGYPAAAGLAIGGLVLGGVVLALRDLRRLDGKVLRLDGMYRRQEGKAVAARGALEAEVRDLRDAIAGVRAEVGELGGAVRAVAAALREARATGDRRATESAGRLEAIDRRLRVALPERLDALTERTIRRVDRAAGATYSGVEALLDLRELLPPRAPMPPLRGWAANPGVVQLLIATMWRHRPGLVVECGSGASSLWLGYAAQRLGTGRVVSLEHAERFLEESREAVRAHGLDDVVEVRHAPLEPWTGPDGTEFPWYSTAALKDLHDIALLFVDGPPKATGPLARYPAVPLLLPRCAPGAMVVLDDAARDDEAQIVERWLAEHDRLELVRRAFEREVAVFRLTSPPA